MGRSVQIHLINRINNWVLKRLNSRRFAGEVTLTSAGLQHGAELIPWESIAEVRAARAEQFVGNTLILVFGLDDGRALTLVEGSPPWSAITSDLPRYLPGARPYEQWVLPVAFGDPPDHLLIFRRPVIASSDQR